MKIEAGGTYQDLANAHRDLISGPASPSGKPNVYGDIPYKFPAAVQLQLPNEPLSDALVGRRRWDSKEVQDYIKDFMDSSSDGVQRRMAIWRDKAVKAVQEA